MKKNISFFFLILAIFIQTNTYAEQKTFKVGALLCLSGACAEWGTNALNGAKLAVNEINEKGGILGRKVQLVVKDTREANSGINSVSAYRNLMTNKNINFILGTTWSIGGLSILETIAKNKSIIITSPTLGIAKFNERANHIYNLWPHDSVATSKLAEFAIKNNLMRVALIGCDDPWVEVQSKTFRKEYKALGGTIIEEVSGTPTDRNVKAETLKVIRKKPDAIMYTDFYRMGTFAKELKKLGFKGKQLSILMDDTRLKEGQGALENTIFASYPQANLEFSKKYKKLYNSNPGPGADTAYDTIILYSKAIKQTKSFDVNIVKNKLLKINHIGASGKILFDRFGGVIKQPLFFKVKKGSFIAL